MTANGRPRGRRWSQCIPYNHINTVGAISSRSNDWSTRHVSDIPTKVLRRFSTNKKDKETHISHFNNRKRLHRTTKKSNKMNLWYVNSGSKKPCISERKLQYWWFMSSYPCTFFRCSQFLLPLKNQCIRTANLKRTNIHQNIEEITSLKSGYLNKLYASKSN